MIVLGGVLIGLALCVGVLVLRWIPVAAVMPIGRPVQSLTRLKRKPVSEFATRDRYTGPPLSGPGGR